MTAAFHTVNQKKAVLQHKTAALQDCHQEFIGPGSMSGRLERHLQFARLETRRMQDHGLAGLLELVGIATDDAAILHQQDALAGQLTEAQQAVANVRRLDPALCIANLSEVIPVRRPDHLAKFAEGLRKAGLPE